MNRFKITILRLKSTISKFIISASIFVCKTPLYVKCLFQGSIETTQKTSATHYLSTAFYTGK